MGLKRSEIGLEILNSFGNSWIRPAKLIHHSYLIWNAIFSHSLHCNYPCGFGGCIKWTDRNVNSTCYWSNAALRGTWKYPFALHNSTRIPYKTIQKHQKYISPQWVVLFRRKNQVRPWNYHTTSGYQHFGTKIEFFKTSMKCWIQTQIFPHYRTFEMP